MAPGRRGHRSSPSLTCRKSPETRDGKQAAIDLKAKFAPKEQEFQKRTGRLQRKQDELRKTENTISEEKKASLTRDIDSMTKVSAGYRRCARGC